MLQANEKQNFTKTLTLSGDLSAGYKEAVDLSTIYPLFGKNFNTLTVINTSNKPITVYLDGEAHQFVTANNGSLSFDHQDGLIYSLLEIYNNDASDSLDLSEVKITVGRTGN